MRGLGDLWAYDTTLRIGACIGANTGLATMSPTDVYLQSGARRGAIELQGKWVLGQRRIAPLDEFRQDFWGLKPYEFENFLCIYRSRLSVGMT